MTMGNMKHDTAKPLQTYSQFLGYLILKQK